MDSLLGASPPTPPKTLGPDEMENRRGRTAPSACTPRTHPVCVGVCVCVFGVCVCVRARVRYCGECAARTWQPAQSTHSDAGRPEAIRASMRSAAMYTHRYAHIFYSVVGKADLHEVLERWACGRKVSQHLHA